MFGLYSIVDLSWALYWIKLLLEGEVVSYSEEEDKFGGYSLDFVEDVLSP